MSTQLRVGNGAQSPAYLYVCVRAVGAVLVLVMVVCEAHRTCRCVCVVVCMHVLVLVIVVCRSHRTCRCVCIRVVLVPYVQLLAVLQTLLLLLLLQFLISDRRLVIL